MTSVFGVTSMSFDKLLTLYLGEGMMIFTAILLVVAIIVFIKSKSRKKLRSSCVVVGVYCILYLGAILALSIGFSSNHKPVAPSVLVKPDSVVYAEVRETNKENAKEVSLYPGDDPVYIEPVFALVNALNAMAPYENEQDHKKNISIYDILFELENGLTITVTVCKNITVVQPVDLLETAEESVGLFETTEEIITACERALESPDVVLDV